MNATLLGAILRGYQLRWDGIHGLRHWARVRENGMALAKRTGAEQLFYACERRTCGEAHDDIHSSARRCASVRLASSANAASPRLVPQRIVPRQIPRIVRLSLRSSSALNRRP